MASGTIKKPPYTIVSISNTWTVPMNRGLTYVEIETVPGGYVPVSATLEVTSPMKFGAFLHVFNPTRYYELNSGARNWMLRIENLNVDTDLTVTGTIRILCVAE